MLFIRQNTRSLTKTPDNLLSCDVLHRHSHSFSKGIAPVLLAGISLVYLAGSISIPYAQDNIETMQSASDNPNSPSAQRYNEFRNFHYSYIAPLAREAERQGLAVLPDEFTAEKALLARMYNDPSISDQIVTDEILARKFAATYLNIKPDANERENSYKQILALFTDGEPPSEQDMASFIETRALGNNPAIREALTRIGKANEQRRVDYENAHPEEMWTVEELQIKSDDDYCLASHHDSSTCQLSVRRFNALVKYQPFPKIVPLDSARQEAVRNILEDQYILNQARKSGYDRSDSAAEAIKGRLEWEAHDARFRNLGTPVTEDGMLHIVYNQHYDLLFSPRKTIYCSFIGSSDSLYIDSLARYTSSTVSAETTKGKYTAKVSASETHLPWAHSSEISDTSLFAPYLDSLQRGGISKPIHTPFGHFLVRLDSIMLREEIPFEDATETLVLLATKKRWRNLDSALSAEAFNLYSTGKATYRIKDTLALAFLLQAGSRPDTTPTTEKERAEREQKIKTTVSEKGIRVSSQQLPPDLLDTILQRYSASDKKKRFFGPIVSPYGICYCGVLSVTQGKGTVPYSRVRQHLLDSLVIASIDSGECVTYEKPDSVLMELTLARVYAPIFMEDDGSGNVAQTGGADSKAMQAKFDAIEEWVKEMKIRIP